MSLQYRAIGWNRQKKIYDATVAVSVAGYLGLFVGFGARVHPHATLETLLIRGLGTASFLLLHMILCIGPLCRLDRRFLPLLYNRRHLGVTMFLLALAHAVFAVIQFHGFGDLSPLVSLLASNSRYDSLAQFPFQQLGLAALILLFLMAATSHDFWLRQLTPVLWKRLHMGVYLAYGLLVGHVALGVLQSETSPVLAGVLGGGMLAVLGLHLAAAHRERRVDQLRKAANREGFVEVCALDTIANNRARVISLSGERIAIFRYDGRVSALSNVCAHQNGPLGEGRIIDGCVTCPWHGYQYLPDSGASPPPFHERVATFRVRVIDEKVFVHPQGYAPGTRLEPACAGGALEPSPKDEFYIGYEPKAPAALARHVKRTIVGFNVIAAVVALVLVFSQGQFPPSVFEFQTFREFEGVVEEFPAPALRVDRPATQGSLPPASRYLLVGAWKRGASEAVSGLHGQRVRLKGSLIYREGLTMVELVPESLQRTGRSAKPPSSAEAGSDSSDLGVHTLSGEIVDSKCYFGVMNPGSGKVHRDCAVRCISGGIPPAFLIRHPRGGSSVLLLVGSDGRSLHREVLHWVGEPLKLTGRVIRAGDTLVVKTEPDTFQVAGIATRQDPIEMGIIKPDFAMK